MEDNENVILHKLAAFEKLVAKKSMFRVQHEQNTWLF